MAGDISRDTFDPVKHFSRVLMQQGRVLLDADWNEQTAIHLHYLRTLAADLIGPAAGPARDTGFRIMSPEQMAAAPHVRVGGGTELTFDGAAHEAVAHEGKIGFFHGGLDPQRNFWIGAGRYYVDGILCENESPVLYTRTEKGDLPAQPDYAAVPLENEQSYFVFLVVWERDVNSLEDEGIREVALGANGPDTATRKKIVWQVFAEKLRGGSDGLEATNILNSGWWRERVAAWQPSNRGLLRAKADEADDPNASNPCLTAPDAHYRGAENQLYRVEIHWGGQVVHQASFKWSRENASVNFPVRSVNGQQLTLETLGRDARLGLQVGDLVELTDDGYDPPRHEESLLRVTAVDADEMVVTVEKSFPSSIVNRTGRPHILRRWDGTADIKERSGANENWFTLEDGVQIQFQPNGDYRTGDYWLIPARTATGDVEWPGPVGQPEARPPHGIDRHLAPLARIRVDDGRVVVERDFRLKFSSLPVEPA